MNDDIKRYRTNLMPVKVPMLPMHLLKIPDITIDPIDNEKATIEIKGLLGNVNLVVVDQKTDKMLGYQNPVMLKVETPPSGQEGRWRDEGKEHFVILYFLQASTLYKVVGDPDWYERDKPYYVVVDDGVWNGKRAGALKVIKSMTERRYWDKEFHPNIR